MLAGLQATSAQVGDLLGALSKSSGHSVDGLTAKRLLDSLPQTAVPLTSRGADLGTVFSQRVSVHVKNMSTAQLVALSQSSPLAGSAGPQLAVVNAAVDLGFEWRQPRRPEAGTDQGSSEHSH